MHELVNYMQIKHTLDRNKLQRNQRGIFGETERANSRHNGPLDNVWKWTFSSQTHSRSEKAVSVVLIVCIVLRFLSGYLENYGSHEQQIILLNVYSSLDNVKQSASDSDSEGKKAPATIPFWRKGK